MHSLDLRESNIPAHLDIEEDIQSRKNGQITFSLRINAGNISDYNNTEYVNAKQEYFGLKPSAEFELTVPLHSGERGKEDSVRDDNV